MYILSVVLKLVVCIQAATEAVSSSSSRGAGSSDSLLRLLQSAGESSRATSAATDAGTPTGAGTHCTQLIHYESDAGTLVEHRLHVARLLLLEL